MGINEELLLDEMTPEAEAELCNGRGDEV